MCRACDMNKKNAGDIGAVWYYDSSCPICYEVMNPGRYGTNEAHAGYKKAVPKRPIYRGSKRRR